MERHGNHSLASQVHAAQQAQGAMPGGCCGTTKVHHDAIAHRAYDIYVKTGSKAGHCTENWHKAESELQAAALSH